MSLNPGEVELAIMAIVYSLLIAIIIIIILNKALYVYRISTVTIDQIRYDCDGKPIFLGCCLYGRTICIDCRNSDEDDFELGDTVKILIQESRITSHRNIMFFGRVNQ